MSTEEFYWTRFLEAHAAQIGQLLTLQVELLATRVALAQVELEHQRLHLEDHRDGAWRRVRRTTKAKVSKAKAKASKAKASKVRN